MSFQAHFVLEDLYFSSVFRSRSSEPAVSAPGLTRAGPSRACRRGQRRQLMQYCWLTPHRDHPLSASAPAGKRLRAAGEGPIDFARFGPLALADVSPSSSGTRNFAPEFRLIK